MSFESNFSSNNRVSLQSWYLPSYMSQNFYFTLPAIIVSISLSSACFKFGVYLCLAEVLVGKTRVPGVKTTAKAVKGFCPLMVRRGSPYCVPNSIGFCALSQISDYVCVYLPSVIEDHSSNLGASKKICESHFWVAIFHGRLLRNELVYDHAKWLFHELIHF